MKKHISQMDYIEIENSLKDSLNKRLNKVNLSYIRQLLKGLNTPRFNNTLLSMGFLKGLIAGKQSRKNDIVYKVLKNAELNTEYKNRYFKEFNNFGNVTKTKKCLKFVIA